MSDQNEAKAIQAMEEHFYGMLRAAGSVDMNPAKFLDFLFFCASRFIVTNDLPIGNELIADAFKAHLDALKKPVVKIVEK